MSKFTQKSQRSREELDKALSLLDEEAAAQANVRMVRANILLRKGELDKAEELYQTELWSASRDVALALVGMYNTARRREDWTQAMTCVDTALAVERVLHSEELGGLTSSLHMLRAEVLLRQGEPDGAMEALTEYVDRSLAQWARLNNGKELHSAFYSRLNMRSSGLSAAYLAKYIRAALEESEDLSPLRERKDFQALLARLAKAGAK